jgi:hypothetical protein
MLRPRLDSVGLQIQIVFPPENPSEAELQLLKSNHLTVRDITSSDTFKAYSLHIVP